VELLRDSGFKWFAMDEEILKKSGVVGDHLGCWETGGIRALFRDRALSDRIGFVYGSWDSEAAVADLIGRLPKRPVFVALDGENPWEGYQDGGVRFLRALLGRVATQSAAELAAEPPIGHIKRIFTGSWIQADFKIWIGDEEDRQAWGLLKEARQEVARVEAEEGESSRVRLAKSRILPAEGSDWFWWFGGEFSTPFAMEFDALFRAHLRGVYRALEKPVPEVLFQPIKKSLADIQPMGPFYGVGGWFDQAGEGSVRLSLGAMAMEFPGELRFGRLPSGECRVRMVPELEGWGLEVEPRGDFLWVRLKTPLGGYFPASGYLEVPLREQRERPI
jgi:alpha-amylase/alpha-mannosidase (GH57 family)